MSEQDVERDHQEDSKPLIDRINEALLAAAKMVWLLVAISVGVVVLLFVWAIFSGASMGLIPA